MGRRFVAQCAGLFVAVLLCIGATQFDRLSAAFRVPDFNPPGCELPCVLNMIPGVTAQSEAEAILASSTTFHPDGESDYQHQLLGDTADAPYIGVKYDGGGFDNNLGYVSIIPGKSNMITLGQMMAAGYKINRLVRTSYTVANGYAAFLVTFDKNEQIIALVVANGKLESSSEVTNIYAIGGPDQAWIFDMIREQLHGDDIIRWVGFASVQEYLAEPALPEQ